MATHQGTKKLRARRSIIDLQIRGLNAKAAFLDAKHETFMPHIMAQAMSERVVLRAEDRERISQILNGNVQPADTALLELIERTVNVVQQAA